MVYATLRQHYEAEGINDALKDSGELNGQLNSNEGISGGISEGINEPQRKVYEFITTHPGVSVPKIAELVGIPSKSVERHIAVLMARHLIERRGSKKTGGYYMV